MARIRTIKPDAFTSDSLSSVPRGTRWTFAGLWTYFDDKGRGRDDVRLIKAALYPLDDTTSLTDVATDLDLLAGIGAICRYEISGKRYLHAPRWNHQKINRPTPAKSPPCPVHEADVNDPRSLTDDSLNPHGAVSEGARGSIQRNRRSDPISSDSPTTHGGLSEPSTWEQEEDRDREKDREKEVSERSATDATPSTALVLVKNDRPDVDRLCDLLADEIAANGTKRPNIGQKWRDAARLMLDRDGRTESEVAGAIRWSQADEFWRTNILSMPKLREQYDRIRLQAERRAAERPDRNQAQRDLLGRAMERAQERERSMK